MYGAASLCVANVQHLPSLSISAHDPEIFHTVSRFIDSVGWNFGDESPSCWRDFGSMFKQWWKIFQSISESPRNDSKWSSLDKTSACLRRNSGTNVLLTRFAIALRRLDRPTTWGRVGLPPGFIPSRITIHPPTYPSIRLTIHPCVQYASPYATTTPPRDKMVSKWS